MIGGKGLKPKMVAIVSGEKDDEAPEGDEGEEKVDATAAKTEAYRALKRAIKMGDDEAGVEALEAFIEACYG